MATRGLRRRCAWRVTPATSYPMRNNPNAHSAQKKIATMTAPFSRSVIQPGALTGLSGKAAGHDHAKAWPNTGAECGEGDGQEIVVLVCIEQRL